LSPEARPAGHPGHIVSAEEKVAQLLKYVTAFSNRMAIIMLVTTVTWRFITAKHFLLVVTLFMLKK
jgi:hypothetical protein